MQSLHSHLTTYWPLHEASGTRNGLVGGVNLTDNNTVTQVAGKVLWGAQFTSANSERLTLSSTANVQTGDIDFTWTLWLYLTTKTGSPQILGKDGGTAGQREYLMAYDSAADRLDFYVFRATDSGVKVTANAFGALSTGIWYFVSLWHDAIGDVVGIEINASALNTTATGGALQAASNGGFTLGASYVPSVYFNGYMAEVGLWKGRILTAEERRYLYNNSFGRTYPFDDRYIGTTRANRFEHNHRAPLTRRGV